MPNSPVSLPTSSVRQKLEEAKRLILDKHPARAILRIDEALAMEAARPKEQVKGLVERARKIACAGEGAPDDLGGDIVTMSLRNPDGFALLEIIEQLAALSQPSPTVAVEGLVEHLTNDDHRRGCEGRQYTCTCGYDQRTNDLAAALSQPSSPEVIRAPDGLDESHYRGLAEGVPVLSNEGEQ